MSEASASPFLTRHLEAVDRNDGVYFVDFAPRRDTVFGRWLRRFRPDAEIVVHPTARPDEAGVPADVLAFPELPRPVDAAECSPATPDAEVIIHPSALELSTNRSNYPDDPPIYDPDGDQQARIYELPPQSDRAARARRLANVAVRDSVVSIAHRRIHPPQPRYLPPSC